MTSDSFMFKLQNLPSKYHWTLNDYSLLFSIYGSKPVVRTGKMYYLTILIKLSQCIGMVWGFIYIVGIIELIKLFLMQNFFARNKRKNETEYPASFFIGFGVAKEEELYSFYSGQKNGVVAKLHQYKMKTFIVWHEVDFITAYQTLLNSITDAKSAISALPVELVFRHTDFLTHIAARIGYYSFTRSWFESLTEKKNSNLIEVVFSCQNLAAFAAVDAGLRSTYLSHGMLTRCELLPTFNSVTALTDDEACFVKNMLPNADVSVFPAINRRIAPSEMLKLVLIASCPVGGDAKYMLDIVPFLQWAAKKKVPVRVRLHPSETPSYFWSFYVKEGLVAIENTGDDFYQTIDRLKPRLLISWVSTTLSDVTQFGVIPITACREDDLFASELAYPIFKRCMKLPKNFESIERLLDDDIYYESVLKKLKV